VDPYLVAHHPFELFSWKKPAIWEEINKIWEIQDLY
jgi:hypothetical protein